MSASNASLEIVLASEKFRLKAPQDSHALLLVVAEEVNRRVQMLHEEGGALTLQRAALMAAFQFAFESREMGERSGLSDEEYQEASERIEALISQISETMQ